MADPMETGDAPATEPATTDDLLRQIIDEQRQHRAEVADLRQQIDSQRTAPTGPAATVQSPEELQQARLEEVGNHSHYCPGCGKLVDYPQQCTGTATAPHPPIEVVSTDELKGDDTSAHTAAPNTDVVG